MTKPSRKAAANIEIDFEAFMALPDTVFEPVSCLEPEAIATLQYMAPQWAEAKAPAVKASSASRPCKRVWDIADAMKGSRRCDVIRACEAEGIATNTAKTQYQQWYSLNK